MKIPNYARYDYCNQRACEFLEEHQINSFPIDVEKIIINSKWGLTRYSELMLHFNCDLDTVIKCLGSEDGYTQFDGYNYSIAYNDSKELGDRKRFTLMHEIGHIYLGHLTDFEATRLYRNSLTKQENQVLENEANAFARNVLVPTIMLEKLKDKSISSIVEQFGITPKAAKVRLAFFQDDLSLNERNGSIPRLVKMFYSFYYKKKCTTCGNSIFIKDIKFCPICGKNTLKWGNGKMKYPTKIRLNENSKALRCPICDNEDIPAEGNFCPICGTELVNQCINIDAFGNGCGSLAAGNARYCIYCGSETTFFHNGLLKPWNDAQNVSIPKDQLEDLNLIRQDWGKIIQELGGAIRPSFRDTVLEPSGDSCLCIVFSSEDSYSIGSRPTVLGELEKYVEEQYGKEMYFKARLKNSNEHLNSLYVSDSELQSAIHMNILDEDLS